MRFCAQCNKSDTIVLDNSEQCRPDKCDPKIVNDHDISTHWIDCPRLIHEVRLYPRLIQNLSFLKPLPDPLPAKYRREGWTLQVDGSRVYRVKTLCRSCIGVEVERETNHRNYLRACKAARREDPTYNQLLMKTQF
jgi:hypothetical protein